MKIRKAESKDILNVLYWRNDDMSRKMSRNEEIISLDEHTTWFNQLLQDKNKLLCIGLIAENAIGMVRFDKLFEPDCWEISIVVNPEYRGKGVGKTLLLHSLLYFGSIFPQVKLIAEMKSTNTTSRKLFENLGFNFTSYKENLLVFSKEIQ